MSVCFIVNLDRSDISSQQMKSFTSLKFTSSQRQSFMKKKIKQTFIHCSFPHVTSEVDKINLTHTHKSKMFLFCPSLKFQLEPTGIPNSKSPQKKDRLAQKPCDTETFRHF